MSTIADVFAVLSGSILLLFFAWESVLFKNATVHAGIFGATTADVPALRWWSFNLGIFSLFIGAAPIVGVIAEHTRHPHVARTLVLYGCACVFLAGLAIIVSGRGRASRGRGQGLAAGLVLCVPAVIAMTTELVAWLG
jgi:putative membrane protein